MLYITNRKVARRSPRKLYDTVFSCVLSEGGIYFSWPNWVTCKTSEVLYTRMIYTTSSGFLLGGREGFCHTPPTPPPPPPPPALPEFIYYMYVLYGSPRSREVFDCPPPLRKFLDETLIRHTCMAKQESHVQWNL